MIYYLAQAYSKDPSQAFKNAVYWTYLLRQKGHDVFSPVLHAHNYERYLSYHDIDYNESLTFEENKLVKQTYLRQEDWVAWDLVILGNMKEVTILFADDCLSSYRLISDLLGYNNQILKFFVDEMKSQGCLKEYNFAQLNHIRCLKLSDFLEGKEVEI